MESYQVGRSGYYGIDVRAWSSGYSKQFEAFIPARQGDVISWDENGIMLNGKYHKLCNEKQSLDYRYKTNSMGWKFSHRIEVKDEGPIDFPQDRYTEEEFKKLKVFEEIGD